MGVVPPGFGPLPFSGGESLINPNRACNVSRLSGDGDAREEVGSRVSFDMERIFPLDNKDDIHVSYCQDLITCRVRELDRLFIAIHLMMFCYLLSNVHDFCLQVFCLGEAGLQVKSFVDAVKGSSSTI